MRSTELIEKLEELVRLTTECLNLFIDGKKKGINPLLVKISRLESEINALKAEQPEIDLNYIEVKKMILDIFTFYSDNVIDRSYFKQIPDYKYISIANDIYNGLLEIMVKAEQSQKEPLYKSTKLKQLEEMINSPLTDEERLYIQDSLKLLEQSQEPERTTEEMKFKLANENGKSTWKGHSQGYFYHFVEGWEACEEYRNQPMKKNNNGRRNIKNSQRI